MCGWISRSQTPPSRYEVNEWHTSPEILGLLTQLVRSSHVIINTFKIVGGVWSWVTMSQVRCVLCRRNGVCSVAGTVCALSQLEDSS